MSSRQHLGRLISFLSPVFVPHFRKRKGKGPPRILLIRPDHIGDVLFSTPALRILRTHLPEAHIVYLVGPWSQRVVELNPNLDEVLVCEFPWYDRKPQGTIWRRYATLLDVARRLSAYEFDAAVNLRFDFWWGALLTELLRVPRRIGYDEPDCFPFLTESIHREGRRHEVERNIRLVEVLLGASPGSLGADSEAGLDFATTEEEERFAEAYLRQRGARPQDVLVAIHPGTGGHLKLWTESFFARLAQGLHRDYGAKVILTGSATERPMVSEIAEMAGGQCVVAAGDTTLGQLVALFRRCKLVVGVDSGPLHLAVACGTPTVHLFGPTDHVAFGPNGDPRLHRVVRSGFQCSPCGRVGSSFGQARGGDCMLAIQPDEVLRAAAEVIGQTVAVAGSHPVAEAVE